MRRNSRSLGLLMVFWAALLGAWGAEAQTCRPARARAGRPRLPPSASLGWANSGALAHGRRLAESGSVRYMPGRSLHFGTEELISLLERVGEAMHRRYGARLTTGDLSAERGGPVDHHHSHQNGRDADLAFFARARTARGAGSPVDLDDYTPFDREGRSIDGRYVFDTARNWSLVEELLTDRRARVAQLFISTPLRARLLGYAREHGADRDLVNRAALTLLQPRGVSPHDNHLHVRIACPDGDDACRDGVRRPPPRCRRRAPAQARRSHASRHEHARRDGERAGRRVKP